MPDLFRGSVIDTADPQRRGRVRLRAPNIYGDAVTPWAPLCAPWGGSTAGPAVGDEVWIAFEAGDRDHPVCLGKVGGGEPGVEVPARPESDDLILRTRGGARILVGDAPGTAGGVRLCAGGAEIVVGEAGITIRNAAGVSLTLVGATISVTGDSSKAT
jgi:hypothetical protein